MRFLATNIISRITKIFVLTTLFAVSGWFVYANETASTFIEIQAKVVKCYPNPATSFINFEFPLNFTAKNSTLQLYSFSGKKMSETLITTAKVQILLNNDFYRGIYIYQIRDKFGKIIETGKFQVVR